MCTKYLIVLDQLIQKIMLGVFNEKQRALDGNKSDWSDLELTVKKKILPKENRIVFFKPLQE